MFTGIISDIGTITSREERGDLRVEITTSWDMAGVKIGESIACNGACLTVVEKTPQSFLVDISGETLSKTHAASWALHARINLERALKMGDDVSGHMVTGHVDGLAELKEMHEIGGSHQLIFEAPMTLLRFIAPKGSVTLHGVSLTVNEVQGQQFAVNIIPHTWAHTNFHAYLPGSKVHVEIDILARYMARLLEASQTGLS